MTQHLIENLNDLIQYAGGEITFQGTIHVGKEVVCMISKNKVHVTGRYKYPITIYFDDFVELNGIAKLFDIYEVALTKCPDYEPYKKEEDELELEMDYNCLLHYNYHQEEYAYFHRNDIKYYFGGGKGSENFIFEMGRGSTPQEAIKNYNKKL